MDDFSPRAHDMLHDQLNGLSDSARHLLDVISVFVEYVVLDELCYIQDENTVEISRQLDQLKGRGLILEKIIHDRVCFMFAHFRLRDFIYSKMPLAKRRRLHELAGMACENVSVFDLGREYHLMIRHYSLAGNYAKALQYRIQKLSGEILPDYQSFVTFTEEAKSELSPQAYMQSLLDELALTKERLPDMLDYDRLEAVLLLAQSRCCLLCGDVETGIAAFRTLIDQQYIWTNPHFIFRAHLQLSDYIIQNTGSGTCLLIETEYRRIKESLGPFEKALFRQLHALPFILGGDKDRARRMLNTVTKHISEKRQ